MSAMIAGIILSTVALLVQGTRCLVRQGAPPFVRRFGALTLLLAGLSAVLFVLIHFGSAPSRPCSWGSRGRREAGPSATRCPNCCGRGSSDAASR